MDYKTGTGRSGDSVGQLAVGVGATAAEGADDETVEGPGSIRNRRKRRWRLEQLLLLKEQLILSEKQQEHEVLTRQYLGLRKATGGAGDATLLLTEGHYIPAGAVMCTQHCW